MKNFSLYLIRCITNLHVGNGDTEFGIIDNQVQRDVITGFPTINSSSLKGSIRNFLENKSKKENVDKIFGSEEMMGLYRIFPGMLLSIPMRSDSKPYYNVTCNRIIEEFNYFLSLSNKSELINISKSIDDNKKLNIEGEIIDCEIVKKQKLCKLFGENLIIIDDKKFYEFVQELPIIARNKLDNGESKNLWYEEVVPRETRFFFGVCDDGHDNSLFNNITSDIVQIGGNATIGYGYCDISKIEVKEVKKDEKKRN